MYIPAYNHESRPEILHEVIRRHSFATLVSHDVDGAIVATPLPFLFDASRNVLRSHMARANPHWQGFAGGGEAMVIFAGPHAYVTPTWYEAKVAVPTWNYVTVHAYGTPCVVEGDSVRVIVEETVRQYESGRAAPWGLERLSEEYVAKMLRAVVGFEIAVKRLEGKLKLSQNRSKADVDGVIAGLSGEGAAEGRELAEWMRRAQG